MKCPGIVDVIAAEVGIGWVRKAPQATGHASLDMRLHAPNAAASVVYSSTLCCHPGMKQSEQDAAVPGGSHHAVRQLSCTIAIT